MTQAAAFLPELERLKLARILLDLSESSGLPSADTETAWDEEIALRLRELRTGVVKGVPLAEVQRRIEAAFASLGSSSILKPMPSSQPRCGITRTSSPVWAGDFTTKSLAI